MPFREQVPLFLQPVQQHYVKLEILNSQESAIAEISGLVTSGSLTIDSTSNIRRVCDLTFVLEQRTMINQLSLLWIDKKFKLFVGIRNLSNNQVVWFKMGIFIVNDPSVNITIDGTSVSINGVDKMALLDNTLSGQVGFGTIIPAKTPVTSAIESVLFDLAKEYKVLAEQGLSRPVKWIATDSYSIEDKVSYLFKYFISKVNSNVNHIPVGDVFKDDGTVVSTDNYWQRYDLISDWDSSVNYIAGQIVIDNENEYASYLTYTCLQNNINLKPNSNPTYWELIDIPLIPYKIEKSASESKYDILKEIANLYKDIVIYYDVDGYFVVRKIKNYQNDPSVFNFTDDNLLISISPQNIKYSNIKNYFKVYGKMFDEDILDDEGNIIAAAGTQPSAEIEITVTNPIAKYASSPFTKERMGENDYRKLIIEEEKYWNIKQCESRAEYEFELHNNTADTLSFTCLPLYFLDVDMIVEIDLPIYGITGKYLIQNISYNFSVDEVSMSIEAYKLYLSI